MPVTLTDKGKVRFFVEAAANPEILRARSFAPTSLGRKDTADPAPLYRLARAEIVEVHPQVRELIADLVALLGLAEVLPASLTLPPRHRRPPSRSSRRPTRVPCSRWMP